MREGHESDGRTSGGSVWAARTLASACALLAAAYGSAQPAPGAPQRTECQAGVAGVTLPTDSMPFSPGERLTFRAHVPKLGTIGRGEMSVDGPIEVRGQPAYRLRFAIDTRVGPVKVVNHSESWLDATHVATPRMAALRFHKHERHPRSRHDERVELYPAERRWTAADGAAGESLSDAPLDELSFLYFLRTLPLPLDTTLRFDRHFDAARNPTTVRLVGRELAVTPAGRFETLLIEMRVKDARRYKGDGVIWINLTDDRCRVPVRIQSPLPMVGRAVLTLESYSREPAPVLARAP
jgi:hypothetical protein